MTVTDDLLANNAEYSAQFNGPLPLPPARQIAVVACVDARLNVYGILGLSEGDVHKKVRGFVFDVAAGTLREVV
jgi:carbonic anhydrase